MFSTTVLLCCCSACLLSCWRIKISIMDTQSHTLLCVFLFYLVLRSEFVFCLLLSLCVCVCVCVVCCLLIGEIKICIMNNCLRIIQRCNRIWIWIVSRHGPVLVHHTDESTIFVLSHTCNELLHARKLRLVCVRQYYRPISNAHSTLLFKEILRS